MATGPEHYLKAEDLVARLGTYDYTRPTMQPIIALQIAEAQVHATLAQAAASALNDGEEGLRHANYREWRDAAGRADEQPAA